jgi:hypothetical protein
MKKKTNSAILLFACLVSIVALIAYGGLMLVRWRWHEIQLQNERNDYNERQVEPPSLFQSL